MNNNINKKGFTLVELLAVIVILAVLALVAMPNVTRLMENARKNSFTTEAEEFAKYAQTAYTNVQLAGSLTSSGQISKFKVPGTTKGDFEYFCISYQKLKADQYVNKSNDAAYGGIIELFIPTSTNSTVTSTITNIYMTNGSYAINGISLSNLASGNYSEGSGNTLGQYNSGIKLVVNGASKDVSGISNGSDEGTKGNLCLTTQEAIKAEVSKLDGAHQFN